MNSMEHLKALALEIHPCREGFEQVKRKWFSGFRVWAAVAVLLFAIGIAAGCGNSNGNSNATETESSSDTTAGGNASTEAEEQGQAAPSDQQPSAPQPEAPAPVTLSMVTFSHPLWPYNANWPIWQFIKDRTGVTLNVEVPPGTNYNDAVNLVIASGDLPDIVFLNGFANANKYGADGAFINIFDHMDKLPNYKTLLDSRPDLKVAVTTADGSSFVLPNDGLGEALKRVWAYRDDIFAKHNLQPPSTYDELHSLLLKLKQLYPDSYPLGLFEGINSIEGLVTAFDTFAVPYPDAGGNWQYGPISDNFKQQVEYLRQFYTEKLIPPDFLSLQRPELRQMFTQDKTFISVDGIGTIDELPATAKETNPAFSLTYMTPPAGWVGGPRTVIINPLEQRGFAISSTTTNLDEVLRYADWLYSDEGMSTVSWGKEGETYTVQAGQKQFSPDFADFADIRTKTGLNTVGAYLRLDFSGYISISSPKLKEAFQVSQNYQIIAPPVPAFTMEENDVISTVGMSIQKHYQENVAKFIVGQRNLDEWDRYVQETMDLGLDKLLATYKTAYDRALGK